VELWVGNEHPKKVMELRRVFAQLLGNAMKCIGSFDLNKEHQVILDHPRGAIRLRR